MTPDRWEQIERLYHSALEREAGERESFLDQACAGDDELRREIASLLAHDGLGDSFIAAPALADAAQLMAGDPLMENTVTQLDAPAVAKRSVPTSCKPCSAKAEWVKSISHSTRGSIARSRSSSCLSRSTRRRMWPTRR